jgi:nucleoid-associated protein YgaU
MSRDSKRPRATRYKRTSRDDDRPEKIIHYTTPFLPTLSKEIISEFTHVRHTWSQGDKFYKLAHKHYGDAQSWWIIALYNSRPTEAHVRVGDTILIPQPVGRVLARYGL